MQFPLDSVTSRRDAAKRSRAVFKIKIVSFITFISFDASANGAHASAAMLPLGLLLGVQGNHGARHDKLYFRLIIRRQRNISPRFNGSSGARAAHFGHPRPTFSALAFFSSQEETYAHEERRGSTRYNDATHTALIQFRRGAALSRVHHRTRGLSTMDGDCLGKADHEKRLLSIHPS